MSGQTPGGIPPNPTDAAKLAVDFVKQIITISAQLSTFVSGGVYFLKAQSISIAPVWFIALGCLLLSIISGLLAFGAFIDQIAHGAPNTTHGLARWLSLGQTILFFGGIICIMYGGFISVPYLVHPPR